MTSGDSIWLAPIQRSTTRAGFGCAGLMGALSRRESLRLLETAWDAGVRHFDVAPVYGHGEAEGLLGTFLRGRRDQVTLVTKFGLEPSGQSFLAEAVRTVARPFAKPIAALRRVGKAPATAAGGSPPPEPPRPALTAQSARLSLERSLRALQTDCIDVLLVHEPRLALLTDDELFNFLENAVQKGMIRGFGIGGDKLHASATFQAKPQYCPFVQCEWSVTEPPPSFPGSQLTVFGVISGALKNMRESGTAADPDLPRVALRAAALALPSSVILLSSRNAAHLKSSIEAISDANLDAAASSLRESRNSKK